MLQWLFFHILVCVAFFAQWVDYTVEEKISKTSFNFSFFFVFFSKIIKDLTVAQPTGKWCLRELSDWTPWPTLEQPHWFHSSASRRSVSFKPELLHIHFAELQPEVFSAGLSAEERGQNQRSRPLSPVKGLVWLKSDWSTGELTDRKFVQSPLVFLFFYLSFPSAFNAHKQYTTGIHLSPAAMWAKISSPHGYLL